jgi:hypothetical protein
MARGPANPVVALGADGSRVVVTLEQSSDGQRIVGQRYGADGSAVNDKFVIGESTATVYHIRIAMNDRGDFVVAWNADARYHARKYSHNGNATDVLLVGLPTHVHYVNDPPAVGIDGRGNFTVVWAEQSGPSWPAQLLMQRISADGTTLGSISHVSGVPVDNQTQPAIAMNEAGDYVVAWFNMNNTPPPLTVNWKPSPQISARRFNASGEAIGESFRVDSGSLPSSVIQPSVDMNSRGEFVVGWYSWPRPESGIQLPIFLGGFATAQRFDAHGTKLGPVIRTADFAAGSARPVMIDEAGNVVLSWLPRRGPIDSVNIELELGPGTGADLVFQVFDAYLESLGPILRVNDQPFAVYGGEDPQGVAMNRHGQFVFVWSQIDKDAPADPQGNLTAPHQVHMKAFNALTANALTIELEEDETISRDAAHGVLAPLPPGSGKLVDLVANARHGRLELIGDGSFTYTPEPDYFGEDSFSYVIVDGNERSAPIKIRLRIKPVNDAPIVETSVDVIKIPMGAGPQRIEGWLREVAPGPANEASQSDSMLWTWTSPRVRFSSGYGDKQFVKEPSIDAATGDLTFELLPIRAGVFTVSVMVSDSAGLMTQKSLSIIVGSAWQNRYFNYDVNSDGDVDQLDLTALDDALAALGEGPLPDLRPNDAPWLDIDGDASLTTADRHELQRYLNGEIIVGWQ